MSASTPSAIISALRPAFEKGKESGDLLFFPSQVHTHQDLGIDVGHIGSPTSPSPDPRSTRITFVLSLVRDQVMPCVAAETRPPDPTL